MNFRIIAALLPLAIVAATKPAFDPRQHKTKVAGPMNEVLVIGTPHLGQMSKPFDTTTLAPVLDRLAVWKPDIITVEQLSGSDCEYLDANRTLTGNAWDNYCWDTKAAFAATGLTVAQANLAIEKRLANWPANPSAAERRKLASLFLAANDRYSAQVQWQRLPVGERVASDGLNGPLVTILERKGAKPNETYDIAVALAVRLGLERIYAVDDHSSDAAMGLAPDAQGEAVQAAWKAQGTPPIRTRMDAAQANLGTPEATLAMYRFYQEPRTGLDTVKADMGANMAEPSLQHYGRWYAAWWEVRNLRMVANIRATMVMHPGSRVLSIVGATHKPYFDAYLDMMQDVRVNDAAKVLR
jgi:hypothetical protein